MTLARSTDRLRSLLEFPWELFEYQRFVAAQARATRATNDMFADDALRFEPRPEDVLVALDDIVVTPTEQGVLLGSRRAGAEVKLEGLSQAAVARMLGLIDGKRTAAEIGWQGPGLERLLRTSFGLMVFAPAAIEVLERDLPGSEITRFPSSPYAIERAYWNNMAAVRRAIREQVKTVLGDPKGAVEFLRELHVITTMGESLDSFYKPSSPISDAGVMPGMFWIVPSRTIATQSGTLFLSGPRAKVHALAGELYHRLVYTQVGDPEASVPERTFADDDGLDWGRVLRARAASDAQFAEWYCLPRPLGAPHFERMFAELAQALQAAERGDGAAAIERAGRFHWRYVHLHPFRCANQSIAMNLVNYVLARILPSGVPHLIFGSIRPAASARSLYAALRTRRRKLRRLGARPHPALPPTARQEATRLFRHATRRGGEE